MSRLLVSLYPTAWRRRYEAEFTVLLQDTGLSPRVVLDVVRGAAAAHARQLGHRLGRLRSPESLSPGHRVVLTLVWFFACYAFWGGWHDIYREVDFTMEWQGVLLANAVFAGLAGFLWWNGRRLLGGLTLLAIALALCCQYGVTPVPDWTTSQVPLTVSLGWFVVLGVVLITHAVRGPARRHPADTPTLPR